MKRLLGVVLATLWLSACGFHLRGLVDMPKWLDHVAVLAKDGNYELVAALKSRLDSYHIDVSPDPLRARYLLIINRSVYEQKIISIGASTNPRQYQMLLTTEYQLLDRKGKIIQPPSTAVITRQLTVNNDRILGSNDEQVILLREMRQDTVTQILNQLSRY